MLIEFRKHIIGGFGVIMLLQVFILQGCKRYKVVEVKNDVVEPTINVEPVETRVAQTNPVKEKEIKESKETFIVADINSFLEQKPETPIEKISTKAQIIKSINSIRGDMQGQSVQYKGIAYGGDGVFFDSSIIGSHSAGAIGSFSALSASDNRIFGVEHNTEEYSHVEETGFKSAKHDPLSTFSIDVDTASYTNVRRFLNNNSLPPRDAVRIEEMINYFDYNYTQPKGNDPFSINIEATTCPWNNNSKLVMVGLQGKEEDYSKMPDNNLVFLIDTSGSMNSPQKLDLLKHAFKLLVEKLRPQDSVSIVTYAGSAGIVLDSAKGSDKSLIMSSLNNLRAGGSTAGGQGIQLAYETAKKNLLRKGNNRVILATDGDFNVGVSSTGELTRLIEEKRDDGIFLSVLGFGMGNYKDSRMESLADKGNGNYAYIDNLMEAKKVFVNDLTGTLFTIAKDVKVQIEFNPEKVKSYRLIGYENRRLNKEDFNNDKKDAGELGSGHRVTALYEIVTMDSETNPADVDELKYQIFKNIKSDEVMTVKLRYKKPDGEKSKLVSKVVTEKDLASAISDNIVWASAVIEFAFLLTDSEHKNNSSINSVLMRAKKSIGTDAFGYRAECLRLMEQAQLLGL